MKKLPIKEIVIPGILLSVAIVLVLVDRFFDYHITGTLFFTGLCCICFPYIIYIIKSEVGFSGVLCVSCYMVFFYLSVYYRFIPAWTIKTIWGLILFALINFGFIIASLIAYYIVDFSANLFKANNRNFVIVLLKRIVGTVLIIATVLLLYSLAKFLISLGFNDKYRDVIINGSPQVMILLMRFLTGA